MNLDIAKKTKLSIENLTCYYSGEKVISNVNLDIYEKDITALIGPSGCGKSTVLRMLNRMNDTLKAFSATGKVKLISESGDINIFSSDSLNSCYSLNLSDLRRKIGMVFQKPNPFPMNIYENVAYGARLLGINKKNKLDEIVEKNLRLAVLWNEVKDKLHKSGLELSGGQQQRLCIARALAVKPEILLLDEPCASLDPIATVQIEDLLIELKEKLTIIIVTHNMQQAGRISDNTAVFWLDENKVGELIEYKPTLKIFSEPEDPRTEGYITGRFG